MADITVIFQAGFNDDSLTVTLNRRSQTLRHLTTDYSIGVADKLTLNGEAGDNHLLIHYPATGQDIEVVVNGEEPAFVVVDKRPNQTLTAEVVAEEGPRL